MAHIAGRVISIGSRMMEKTFANDPRTRASERAMELRRRRPALLAVCAAVGGMLALGVSAGTGVHVSRVGGSAATAGRPWVVKLAVRPKSFRGAVRVVATGPGRLSARARGGHGTYRARLVFPKPGLWTLHARAGRGRPQPGA